MVPAFKVDLWDYAKTHKFLTINYDEGIIRPTTYDDLVAEIDTGSLVPGQYVADVVVDECNVEKEIIFDILEEGEVDSEGEITEIRSEVRSIVGDTTKFIIVFENTGEKTYDAQFKGDIVRDGQIVGVVSSDKLLVKAGQSVELEVYYKSEDIGLHQLQGYVYYDKKRTLQQSATLKVFPESMREEVEASKIDVDAASANTTDFSSIITVIIIIAIIALLLIIIKKKKSKFRY